MTKQPDVYSAKLKAEKARNTELDKYNNVVDNGEHRQLGSFDITADSLEKLKEKLHAHIDLLE